jgi:2-oxoglutarate ferredoxin oxidoreductase subunit alpha
MLDKYLSNSIITCSPFEYKNLKIERGKILEGKSIDIKQQGFSDHFKRFKLSDDPISLRVPLGTENGIFWNTGDEHDEMGHITEDPETRTSMMEKRLSKLELIQGRIPKEEQITIEFENNTSGKVKKLMVIVSWGSTKGAILDSLEKITEADDTIQFLYLQIKLLNPFPARLLEDIVRNKIEKVNTIDKSSSSIETIVTIIEMNYLSQLDVLLKQNTTLRSDHNILKYNGRPMSHTEIYNSLINIINNQSKRRVILKNGV